MEKKQNPAHKYNPSTMIGPTCGNCVDKLTKDHLEPCLTCNKEACAGNRFPKWRSADESVLSVPSE